MFKSQAPFEKTSLQSDLYKAGIRFDFNRVDTVCKKRFGLGFYFALALVMLLFTHLSSLGTGNVSHIGQAVEGNIEQSLDQSKQIMFTLLAMAGLGVYLCSYMLKVLYYLRLRSKLRKDDASIKVEAYTVVCLDVKNKWTDYLMALVLGPLARHFYRYAVVYKEVGTNHPRFFITAAVSAQRICFIPEHLACVFIHRKNHKLYSVDDKSSYQTVSKKLPVFQRLMTEANSVAQQKQKEIARK